MDRISYENDLKKRQSDHLKQVELARYQNEYWQPCLHDQCPECIDTGVKIDGSVCIHFLSCSCPKCTPTMGLGGNYATSTIAKLDSNGNVVISDCNGYTIDTSTSTWTIQEISA
jgi:hypothetical protein